MNETQKLKERWNLLREYIKGIQESCLKDSKPEFACKSILNKMELLESEKEKEAKRILETWNKEELIQDTINNMSEKEIIEFIEDNQTEEENNG